MPIPVFFPQRTRIYWLERFASFPRLPSTRLTMSRRRISCPNCDAQLAVTPAAEEHGRMRCPKCQQILDVPAEDARRRDDDDDRDDRRRRRDDDYDDRDYDDRPRRKRQRDKSGSKMWLWLTLGGGLALLFCCGGPIGLVLMLNRSEASQSPVPLMQARAGFQTKLTIPQNIAAGPPPRPPLGSSFELIRYNSAAGNLAAYLSADPRDGKKHPAIIWAHGGFGGIGEDTWEEDSAQMIFLKAGLVVMAPSWRGEADNPGQYEMFYGEVDDAVAAVEHVSKLPYVDPKRIYMAGHSTGGTITLLTVEATEKLRAAFSFGGAPDLHSVFGLAGLGYGNTLFDYRDKKERRLRSPIDFIHHVRTPTFYFEGASEGYAKDAQKMEKWAKKAGAPVSVYLIPDGDHFDIVEPICRMLVKKIQADTGPACTISTSMAEVQRAYDAEGN